MGELPYFRVGDSEEQNLLSLVSVSALDRTYENKRLVGAFHTRWIIYTRSFIHCQGMTSCMSIFIIVLEKKGRVRVQGQCHSGSSRAKET